MSVSPRILSVVAGLLLLGATSVPAIAQITRAPEAITAYDEGVKQLGEEKWDAAIAAFSKAIEVDNMYAEAYLGRAEALRHQEDYAGAITSYNSARDIDAKLPQIYVGRGICYQETGVIDLAINDFQNA